MKQSVIFPGVLGCEPRLAADALRDSSDWSEPDYMIRFEANNRKAGQKCLDLVLDDPRLFSLCGLSLQYEKKPTLRQIVKSATIMPNLRYVWFSGPRNWNHFEVLQAFPGIERMYAQGITWPFDPVRHVGLKYFGLAPERWGIRTMRALSESVLLELEILALDLATMTPTETIEILNLIARGQVFPKINHLHLRNCRFSNALIQTLFGTPGVVLKRLDLMNCPINNKSANLLKKNFSGMVLLDQHRMGSLTLKSMSYVMEERFQSEIEVEPF